MKKPNIMFLLNDHQAYYRHGWDNDQKLSADIAAKEVGLHTNYLHKVF